MTFFFIITTCRLDLQKSKIQKKKKKRKVRSCVFLRIMKFSRIRTVFASILHVRRKWNVIKGDAMNVI